MPGLSWLLPFASMVALIPSWVAVRKSGTGIPRGDASVPLNELQSTRRSRRLHRAVGEFVPAHRSLDHPLHGQP